MSDGLARLIALFLLLGWLIATCAGAAFAYRWGWEGPPFVIGLSMLLFAVFLIRIGER